MGASSITPATPQPVPAGSPPTGFISGADDSGALATDAPVVFCRAPAADVTRWIT